VDTKRIDDVLWFWFGFPARNEADFRPKMRRWYAGGPIEDGRIRARFRETVEHALAGQLDAWAETPRGCLALIVLLDQMTRSLFRGTARAFAGDARAQQLALELLEGGGWCELDFEERHFVFMPLLHAEDAALLDLYNATFPDAVLAAPAWARPMLGDGMEQGVKYRDVLARFGRFPHRNEALGRLSTPAERAFLTTWGARAAPRGAAAYAAL
jgi:uncharacterized protein (DUF924 family)